MKHSNPSLYRKLSQPHDSPAAFDEALNKFREGVSKLREEFRIPDVILITAGNAYTKKPDPAQGSLPGVPAEEPTEGRYVGVSSFGDRSEGLQLLAFAYGKEKAEFSSDLAGFLRGGGQ